MVKTPRLYASFRATVDGEKHQLAVVEVLQFRLNTFGHTRVIGLDPTNAWAAFAPTTLGRLQSLLGKEYPSFAIACQAIYGAYHPNATRTDYMRTFECFVSGLTEEQQRLLQGPGVVERVPMAGEMIDSRFTPNAATLAVTILPMCDLPDQAQPSGAGSPPSGVWLPIGPLRPIAPASMPDAEVEAETRRMCEQGFAKQKHTRDRQPPKEEGEIGEGTRRAKRSKKKMDLRPGKAVWLDEATLAAGDTIGRLPHVIEGSALTPPADNPSLPAYRHVTLRSLADGSSRTVPAGDVLSLARYFGARCRQHFCAAPPYCTACTAMIDAVHAQCALQTPPHAFVCEWRCYAAGSGVEPPAK